MTDAPLDVTEHTNAELEDELENEPYTVDQLYALRGAEEETQNRVGAIEAINEELSKKVDGDDEDADTAESVATEPHADSADGEGSGEGSTPSASAEDDSGESDAADDDGGDGDGDVDADAADADAEDPYPDAEYVTVTPAPREFKQFGGSYFAGIFFEHDSQNARVRYNTRIRRAIEAGKLEVVSVETAAE